MIGNVFTLLFAPSFLILIRFYDFKSVVLLYILLASVTLFTALIKRKKPKEYAVLLIYILLLIPAYFSVSFDIVKFIPAMISMAFFALFAQSAIKKQELIYKFTTKFYKKELSAGERAYLKQGDAYWAFAILLFTIGQIVVSLYASDVVWAFYSSIGWYIYFVVVLALQIVYGKLYAIKMYT